MKSFSLPAILLLCLAMGCNSGGEWPNRPLTLVCPWSAGGGTDRVARQLAVQLEQELNVPVNVVNATGGGGVTGHSRGAQAAADGYTLTLATVELNMLHWQQLCPVTPESFQPLAMLNEDSAAVFVMNSAPWQSLAELSQALQTADAPLKASGTAAGGIWHIALMGWLDSSQLPLDSITWISINGSAPSLQELLAGGVDLVCCSIPEARALLDAGEIRCLGVMSAERSPAAPDVPTFTEQGFDWSMGGWRGVMFPIGVPDRTVQQVEHAVLKIAAGDEFQGFMQAAGFQTRILPSVDFREFLKHSDEQFGKILQSPQMSRRHHMPIGPYMVPSALLILILIVVGGATLRQKQPSIESNRSNALTNTLGAETSGAGTSSSLSAPLFTRSVSLSTASTLPFGVSGAWLWSVGSIVVFIAMCETAGYVLSSAAMLLILLAVQRVRPLWSVGIVLVAVPALYQLFSGVLGVPLPWGWLGW
ncbi:MAG: tripartite tricarboxylate transporter TctB family protein [Planctomycetaceae bacterium]|nr:tripartite tricarboxylate transporter TctB family protein [Planctomycetaceae bacterium]